ncbi:clostripain-related cysteine peptidase [Crocosphaera sp. XPORK-15E]|uniref:clostripain-related cysteine peptidase n=1 Tax=Crocosphaera sp. XPORK-15E TaxID=3110247 RepID=UPI002B1F6429|nr:clostripain-related cysteine peptidase [Crocosphaera sp. XPORK-15E]MEA5535204.1 clostripain-related cysteine peptidase [Crocosphaera sp. XPORK-15E]
MPEPNNTILDATLTSIGEGQTEYIETDLIEASGDVDLYQVFLSAGDVLTVDVDAFDFTFSGFDPILRIFDEFGSEVYYSDDDPAPGEFNDFLSPYAEFEAFTQGSYYVGVSDIQSDFYDPFGGSFAFFTPGGQYTIDINTDGNNNGGIQPDIYEENDDAGAATFLIPDYADDYSNEYYLSGMSVEANDADWYRFTVDTTNAFYTDVSIDMYSDIFDGDIDFRVYKDNNGILEDVSFGQGETGNSLESVYFQAEPGAETDYLIEVFGFLGDTTPYYDLSIYAPGSGNEPMLGFDDIYEDNDSIDEATIISTDAGADVVLGEGQDFVYLSNLVSAVDSQTFIGDDDWFEFQLSEEGDFNSYIQISWQNLGNDLDLELYDSEGELVNYSWFGDGYEYISLEGVDVGTYYAKVVPYGIFNFDGSTIELYDFSLSGPISAQGQEGGDDEFEENDTADTAHILTGSDLDRLSNLDLVLLDEDWYQFSLPNIGEFDSEVKIEFSHSKGDLDLELYQLFDDGSLQDVGFSAGVGNIETISLDGFDVGNYLIKVYGFDGATNDQYSLSLTLPEGGVGDNNDDFDNATFVGPREGEPLANGTTSIGGLSINGTDVDFYKFELAGDALFGSVIDVLFQDDKGDLDVALYDGNEDLIYLSDSASDNEEIDLWSLGLGAGEYFVEVYGYDFGQNNNNNYDLAITYFGEDNTIGGDEFESNNDFDNATELSLAPGGTKNYNGLSIDSSEDDDYFQLQIEQGQLDIVLSFAHNEGDLDLELFNEQGQLIDFSDSTEDTEIISLDVEAGTYYARVFGYAGDTNPDYQLEISVPGSKREGEDALDDQYEENDSFETATVFNKADTDTFGGLKAFDDDYYRFTLSETGQKGNEVSILFSHYKGDLDLELYRVNGEDFQFVAIADSITDNETLSLSGQAAGDYVALVYGYGDATNDDYTLTFNLPGGGVGGQQPLENIQTADNDTRETAYNLTLDDVSKGIPVLSIEDRPAGQPVDEDWYQLVLAEDGGFGDGILVTFDNALGDVDIALWDQNNEDFSIRLSQGVSNAESISLAGLAAGTYFLEVFGFNGATNPEYTLEVQAPLAASQATSPSQADRFEVNNTFDTPKDFGQLSGFKEYADLSIHEPSDVDWFKFTTVGAGDVDVALDFFHSAGDIDLEIFQVSEDGGLGQSLARSTTVTDDEFVRVTNAEAGEFLVKVSGYQGAINPNYTLSITAPVGSLVSPDKYDLNGNNNTQENATLIGDFRTRGTGVVTEDETGKSVVIEDLTIHNGNDEDWFEFRTRSLGKLDSQVSVLSDVGDLNLVLFDEEGNLVADRSATGEGGYQTISLKDIAAGTYFAQVTGVNGATNANYSISLNSSQPAPVAEPEDSLTIMIYMAADNELEMNALRDLNELESINLPDNVNIVVQLDRSEGYDSSNGDWTDTRRGLVQYDPNSLTNNGQIVSLGEGTSLGELNMGDGATLTEFIDWSKENYTAQNYALVVWDNGGGLDGVAWDEQSVIDGVVDNLGIAEITQAVDSSQVDKFGLIGFDASSQGLIEHGYDLRNLTDVFVASQDLEPGDGWNYAGLLEKIAANPTLNSEALGGAIVDSYKEYYNGLETLSAIDTSKYEGIGDDIDIFVDAVLTNATEDDWNEIIQARYETPSFYNENYRDLGLFMDNVAANVATGAIATAATAVSNAVSESVFNQVDGLETSGMNIYLSPANSNLLNEYENNTYDFGFLQDTNWEGFLLGLGERTGETRVKGDDSEQRNGIDGVVQRDNNGSIGNATDLGLLSGPESFGDLSIVRQDKDYYRFDFETAATTDTTVSIESEQAAGLTIEVFNEAKVSLARIDVVDGTESINIGELNDPTGDNDRYYVLVEGDDGKTVVDDYTLVINAPDLDPTTVNVDGAETKDGSRNDSYLKATDLGQLGQENKISLKNLTLDQQDLELPEGVEEIDVTKPETLPGDWYKIDASRGGDVSANTAQIEVEEGEEVELLLYQEDAETGEMMLVDQSSGSENGVESVTFDTSDSYTGTYWLCVCPAPVPDPLTGLSVRTTVSSYSLTVAQRSFDADGNGNFTVQDTQLFFASQVFAVEQFDSLNQTYGFIQAGAQRTFATELFSYWGDADGVYDVDGDSFVSVQDAQLAFIYNSFGNGDPVAAAAAIDQLDAIYGLIQDGATRTTGAEISAQIAQFI